MFKPSLSLQARLRLTTKQVNKGYYKGTGSGSMGAHTGHGGYLIDYRKVRHYNMPDLSNFNLTPFVTRQMEKTKLRSFSQNIDEEAYGNPGDPNDLNTKFLRGWQRANLRPVEKKDHIALHVRRAEKYDVLEFLRQWRLENLTEYEQLREFQTKQHSTAEPAPEQDTGMGVEETVTENPLNTESLNRKRP